MPFEVWCNALAGMQRLTWSLEYQGYAVGAAVTKGPGPRLELFVAWEVNS